MSLEEIAAKHFPYNTTCPNKRKKINYQRENLVNDLKDWYIRQEIIIQGQVLETKSSNTSLLNGDDLIINYTTK